MLLAHIFETMGETEGDETTSEDDLLTLVMRAVILIDCLNRHVMRSLHEIQKQFIRQPANQ